ncbi:MAG TPA: hypothetical protein H9871_11720 [Candidatus Nesterenkonia stercoripullorum]|uniref:Uncharacterized protein n=1 Tax=Candidatus Nesterenkonia stercoripullorum TaxID=2838701 RepID=A0A9D1UUT6_9MICC|nr:hypothetical protein [Candidatus Nesterenkonia stercoripullorum]
MTQRREIITKITKAAKSSGMEFTERREGARHTLYDLDGIMIPIPRHRDIPEKTTRDIYIEAEEKLGKGWWRK